MTANIALDVPSLLASNVTVPHHVVYRSFPVETVALNLETGQYHGLNVTAGRMLEELERASTVREAAIALAASYDKPQADIEADLCALCGELAERGLIDVDGNRAS
jgi:hypothetical protein